MSKFNLSNKIRDDNDRIGDYVLATNNNFNLSWIYIEEIDKLAGENLI